MRDDATIWAAIEEIKADVASMKAEFEGVPRERAISVMLHARLAFDAPDKAEAWLVERSADLGGSSPLEAAMESPARRDAVMSLLMRRTGHGQELEQELDALLARIQR